MPSWGTARQDAALGCDRGQPQGERSLLRALTQVLEPGDALLVVRYSSDWFDIVWSRQRSVNAVMRWQRRRRRGRRLGRHDRHDILEDDCFRRHGVTIRSGP